MEMMQILKDLTSNILETMFFLIQETEPDQPKFDYRYAVNIKDPRADVILLYCERTAREMTVNFIGTDEIEVGDIHDTLKESINIIAGNFMGQLNGNTNKIHIPVLIENIASIDVSSYEQCLLFYNEEPVQILLKMGE